MVFAAVLFFLILAYSFRGVFTQIDHPVSRRALVFTFLVLALLAGFRGPGIDNDYAAYLIYFDQPIVAVEPSFYLIRWLAQIAGAGAVGLFVCYAFWGVGLKIIAINKLTSLFWFSVAIYLSNIYLLQDVNQIRAGVASGFVLLMIKPIYDRKFKLFLLYCILASLFHFSALTTIVLYFLVRDKASSRSILLWSMLPVLGYLLYFFMSKVNVFALIPFDDIRFKLEMYKNMQEMGAEGFSEINLFNLHAIFRLVLFFLLISKYEFLRSKNIYFSVLIKTYAIALFLFPVLGAITPLLGYRTSELFGVVEVVLYPMMVYLFRPAVYSKLTVIFVAVLLFAINVFYKQLIYL